MAPVVVGDDPQVPDLVGQLAGLGLGVVVGDADQHAQPGADRAHHLVADRRRRPGPRADPLQHQHPAP